MRKVHGRAGETDGVGCKVGFSGIFSSLASCVFFDGSWGCGLESFFLTGFAMWSRRTRC